MTIQITKSQDNSGTGDETFGLGSTARDLLISFNRTLTFLQNSAQANAGLVISTNFDVKNGNAITYTVAGVQKTLSANTNFDTGTAAVISANKWSIAILTHDGSTATVTWAAATTQGYATEALAIAQLRSNSRLAPASGFASIGYVTVLTGTDVTWTAGTDALAGGSGGTPATTTNYYNDPTLNGSYGGWLIGNLSGTTITQ